MAEARSQNLRRDVPVQRLADPESFGGRALEDDRSPARAGRGSPRRRRRRTRACAAPAAGRPAGRAAARPTPPTERNSATKPRKRATSYDARDRRRAVEAVKSGMTPGFADALPTWKTNAPRIGWVSAETTLQATVYVPSARSGFSAIATVLSSGPLERALVDPLAGVVEDAHAAERGLDRLAVVDRHLRRRGGDDLVVLRARRDDRRVGHGRAGAATSAASDTANRAAKRRVPRDRNLGVSTFWALLLLGAPGRRASSGSEKRRWAPLAVAERERRQRGDESRPGGTLRGNSRACAASVRRRARK